MDVRLIPLGFPPFFTPQFCSCSVYFPNMFAFVHPCHSTSNGLSVKAGKRSESSHSRRRPGSDPNSSSPSRAKKKLFQMLWRSRECVCHVLNGWGCTPEFKNELSLGTRIHLCWWLSVSLYTSEMMFNRYNYRKKRKHNLWNCAPSRSALSKRSAVHSPTPD